MLPSPLPPATKRARPSSPSVSVVLPVRDPAGLPLMLRGLPPVDEVVVVAETGSAAAVAARNLRPGAGRAGPARGGLRRAAPDPCRPRAPARWRARPARPARRRPPPRARPAAPARPRALGGGGGGGSGGGARPKGKRRPENS